MKNFIHKNYKTLLVIIFFAITHCASAAFEITEIMYDVDGTDTNREWVEVQNTGSGEADLSRWYLFTDNTKHALAPQGTSLVPAGGYAVIAQNALSFRTDWPNFSGLLFDSSWSGLNNDGETIALKDPDLNIVSSVSFSPTQGGGGDGTSTSKVNGSWVRGKPTPGVSNEAGSTSSPTGTAAATPEALPKKKEVEEPRITTDIITPKIVFAGVPFVVDNSTLGYNKEPILYGRYLWNMGDGTTKEEQWHVPFQYVYQYPGEYVISLLYYRAPTDITLDATDRFTITVLVSPVTISGVGGMVDPFVELKNSSSSEVDLTRWTLQGSIHTFYIPLGTILLPNKTLRFSSKVTGFTEEDVHSVSLQTPLQDVAAHFPLVHNSISLHDSFTTRSMIETSTAKTKQSSDVIDLNSLSASTVSSVTEVQSSVVVWGGLIGVILVGCSIVILLRKKDVREYTDPSIRAEDMTIME